MLTRRVAVVGFIICGLGGMLVSGIATFQYHAPRKIATYIWKEYGGVSACPRDTLRFQTRLEVVKAPVVVSRYSQWVSLDSSSTHALWIDNEFVTFDDIGRYTDSITVVVPSVEQGQYQFRQHVQTSDILSDGYVINVNIRDCT